MEFIDHTGHVFSLPTFDDKPIAIQYTENDYIFWIKDNPVSINNYYILPIRFLLDYDNYITQPLSYLEDEESDLTIDELFSLTISLSSNFYKLIGPKYIQSKLEKNKDINQPIEFDLNDFKEELTLSDFYFELSESNDQNLIVYNNDRKFLLFPFYIIGKSNEEGTYLSNIMIHTHSYQEKKEEREVIWLDQDGMYDYLMKKTFDDISIYEINEFGEKELWFTLESGYKVGTNEIITAYQNEYRYRIRNWGLGLMKSDVYHYIYRLPQDKWLKPGHKYVFSGHIKQSCNYCGSTLYYNHDGYINQDDYWKYKNYVPTPNCLFDLNGKPFYPEAYDYDEDSHMYTPKDDQLFALGSVPSKHWEYHSYGEGFDFHDDIEFIPGTTIRDFFFDVDNKAVTENTSGGYVEYKYYSPKDEYTQLTVGCTFIDECEELIINGKNMGINLPKEILKAIYSSSFYNKYADEKLIKSKMKELLLNYMSIKGECGNFKSVINSLKWFGWADKIEISKLIKTDNEFQDQYILDYFNITTDLKDTYKYFNTTNLISLSIKGNQETGEYNQQDFSQILIGEGKPILEDLFDKTIEVTHNELKFYKPYYDFLFNELALKLDCLAYYWQKYFLPIHLKINRASIEYKVYANTTKLSCAGFEKIIEKPVIIHIDDYKNKLINVVFPDSHKVLYNKSIHYIDNKFNEFSNYNDNYTNEDLYYVNENCIVIPITIEDLNNQYTENKRGEYLLIDGEYIRPFKFYMLNEEEYLDEVDDPSNADYYQLYYYSDYEELYPNDKEPYKRYSKITEDYFQCKIFLSYLDNTTNQEKYLIKDNIFNYYQTINQYYCNYIIIPRLIQDKSFDWLNTKFKLSIVVNNKWFDYDFIISIPNIYLDLGKLEYRYFIDNKLTMFNQIDKITDSNKIIFKSFLYQPDLVSIDTLFYNKDNYQILTFIQKLIETNGDQNLIYDFYKKYYQNSINVPYNPKYYNRIHIFDLYKTTDIETYSYEELPVNPDGNTLNDDQWNNSEFVTQLRQDHPTAVFENGIPNFTNLNNVASTIEESLIYDVFSFQLINDGIRYHDTKEVWDEFQENEGGLKGIVDHGTFEDGIRCFATWFLADFYPDEFIQGHYHYIYHIYDLKIYDDNHTLVYHIKNHKSIQELKDYTYDQLEYRMWNKEHIGYEQNNPHTNYKFNEGDPYNILQYYDVLIYDHPYGNSEKIKFTTRLEDDNITYNLNNSDIKLYKLFFDKNGNQLIDLNENPVEYDLYLMHDNYEKEDKYWYVVAISRFPISNYSSDQLKIHQEEYLINSLELNGTYLLKYSGFSIDKFLINRMDIIPSNGFNHFNKDDLVIATINNNNYQFNIDLSNKWVIKHVVDINNVTQVESNTNIVIVSNNNIDHLYTPGYYNITLNYTINGLNDQIYEANGRYLIDNEYSNISYPIINIIEEEKSKISVDTVISDFSILYENTNGERKITTKIMNPSSGYVPIGIKIVNEGYFSEDSHAVYMGLKLMDCQDPDNGFAGEGSKIYHIENGEKVYYDNPYWGFYNQSINDMYQSEEYKEEKIKYFPRICYKDNNHTISCDYVYPQTDDWTKIPLDDNGKPKYPAPNNRGFHYDSSNNHTVNLLNNDDTINWDLIDDSCAIKDWDGRKNTNKLLYLFDQNNYPNWKWKTSKTIPNIPNEQFSPSVACCWRYHTLTTNQGDWYLPSFAEVFFVTYNFKRYSEIFEELSYKFPEYCKPDLLKCIGSNALWSSTSRSNSEAWEIHPCQHAHSLSKRTTGWYTIPFIQLEENQQIN